MDGSLHLIGNAHLDPVWFWRWTEGCQEARATFRSVLDRMMEFPGFVFTCAQAALYKWIEEIDPAMFAEIKARVGEGRWAIVGGWWVQPDCNLPGGESFARQALYAQRYFQDRFGTRARVGYNVDSFGHHAMLPQLLQKAGLDNYIMMRPDKRENPALPEGAFWWESPDGSRVLTYRIEGGYGNWGSDLTGKIQELAAALRDDLPLLMVFYGVGNHGGGPTIENLRSIEKLQNEGGGPKLVLSSPNAYFDALRPLAAGLPVWRSEMQHHASGCYSTTATIKRANREAENRLLSAEKWNAAAGWLCGIPPATGALALAWENVLFNQFHDIMGGCSIREAYEDVHEWYGEAKAVAARVQNQALQALASRVDTRGEGEPILVFNPHSFPIKTHVEVECGFFVRYPRKPRAVADETGAPVSFQPVRPSMVVKPGAAVEDAWLHRLCLQVELPAFGYRTYRVLPEPRPLPPGPLRIEMLPCDARVMDGRRTLAAENEYLRLEVDGRTGCLARLYDKQADHEVLSGPGAVPLVLDDRSDTWSHGVFAYRDVAGRFGDARVTVMEQGPVRIVLRAESSFGDSRLFQDFILYAGRSEVEVRVKADWRERLRLLKLAFPVRAEGPTATYEIPCGAITRPTNGEEEPYQSWFDLTGRAPDGGAYGLAILNEGKYSADVLDCEMRFTALRSAAYAHHTDNELPDTSEEACMDLGWHEFRYVLLPHAGDWHAAEVVRRAQVLNSPPVVQVEYKHQGSLPPRQSLLSCDAPSVVVTVIKYAEEQSGDGAGAGWILRAYETAGKSATAAFELPVLGRTFTADFGPYEMKTFFIPREPGGQVRETNLIEDWTSPPLL